MLTIEEGRKLLGRDDLSDEEVAEFVQSVENGLRLRSVYRTKAGRRF